MRGMKALVIEHDAESQEAVEEVLEEKGHEYDLARSIAEARKLIAANSYSYVLLDYESPSRAGRTPRPQNSEHFLRRWDKTSRSKMPPVILIAKRMPDVDDEDKFRWAAKMRSLGVTTFICRPFRLAGRTLDNVIDKLFGPELDCVTLAEEHEESRADAAQEAVDDDFQKLVDSIPFDPLPWQKLAPPDQPAEGTSREAPATPTATDVATEKERWLTVTQAAQLLMKDLPWLDLAHARARISTACNRGEIKTNGRTGRDRRLDLHTFNTWRLKQRDKGLDQEEMTSGNVANQE